MDCVIVRTRLQSLIVRRLVETGVIAAPFHLVLLVRADGHLIESALEGLLRDAGLVARRTLIQRPPMRFAQMWRLFLRLLIEARRSGGHVYCSNFGWYPLAVALRCLPGYRIRTFDDGTANIQRRDNSFLSEAPSAEAGWRGWVARLLFPKGPALFARSRIERHWTLYPWAQNVVPADRLEPVEIDWSGLMEPEDAVCLPASARRIYVGTVYPEARKRGISGTSEADEASLLAWSDLYLPHPRDESAARAPEHLRRYPAETIISHYAQRGPLVVAHHNSSAVLPFLHNPAVTLFDLCTQPVDDLILSTEPPTA
jgi:hypothetical protein